MRGSNPAVPTKFNAPLVQRMRIRCYERRDGGSIPSWGTSFIGVLCSGSISDFDSESVGSIPTTPAKFVEFVM